MVSDAIDSFLNDIKVAVGVFFYYSVQFIERMIKPAFDIVVKRVLFLTVLGPFCDLNYTMTMST